MILKHCFTALVLVGISTASLADDVNNRFDDAFGEDSSAPGDPKASASPDAPAQAVNPTMAPLPRARPAKPLSAAEVEAIAKLRNSNLCVGKIWQTAIRDQKGTIFQGTICRVKSSGTVATFQAWCSEAKPVLLTLDQVPTLRTVCTARAGVYAPPEIAAPPTPVPAVSQQAVGSP